MKNKIFLVSLAIPLILTGCNAGEGGAEVEESKQSQFETVEGFVWEDANGDGINADDENPIQDFEIEALYYDDAGELIASDSDENTTFSDELGWFEFTFLIGQKFRLKFIAPDTLDEEVGYKGFTKRDVGSEKTDSDVDVTGQTDIFTVTEGFFPTLSAGLLPGDPPLEPSPVTVEDPRDDCVLRNKDEKQVCAGDIHRCDVTFDPDAGRYEFTCILGPVTDYSELDFYVVVDVDGDPTTGKSEGQATGVDADLYLNSLEDSIQLNRYDPMGNYIRGDVFESDKASAVFGPEAPDGEGSIGIALERAEETILELFGEQSQLGFVVVTYQPSGIQLLDHTDVVLSDISSLLE